MTIRMSIQPTEHGYSIKFDDYYVSINATKLTGYVASQAYAECITIANAIDLAANVDYDSVTEWAKATVRMERAARGDSFATAEETDYILDDVWAYRDSWIGEFNHAFGRGIVEFELWPDHSKKTIDAGYSINVERIGRADHAVFVSRDGCVVREN